MSYVLQVEDFRISRNDFYTLINWLKYLFQKGVLQSSMFIVKSHYSVHSKKYVMDKTMVLTKTDLILLEHKIEELRSKLHGLANQNGFVDQTVIELSQKLDKYIVRYQKLSQRRKQ